MGRDMNAIPKSRIEYLANRCKKCKKVIQTEVDRHDLEDFVNEKVSQENSFPNLAPEEKSIIFKKECRDCI